MTARKSIELTKQFQRVFDDGTQSGYEGGYEQGLKDGRQQVLEEVDKIISNRCSIIRKSNSITCRSDKDCNDCVIKLIRNEIKKSLSRKKVREK